MANSDVRVGITATVKDGLIPAIDRTHFLGYDDEDRIVLYTMAVALATRCKMAPQDGNFIGLVRGESIPDDELMQLLLMYLENERNKDIEGKIDDIGVSRRKEIVKSLDQLANAGFALFTEKMSQPEEMVVADFFNEMDEEYAKLEKDYPELGLPPFRKYNKE